MEAVMAVYPIILKKRIQEMTKTLSRYSNWLVRDSNHIRRLLNMNRSFREQ